MRTLDLDDIQANIVRGYRSSRGVHLLLRFGDAEGGRSFVGTLRGMVTTSRHWAPRPGPTSRPAWHAPSTLVNVGFTHAGLSALGLSRRCLASFPSEFRDGMKARAGLLQDAGESSPDRWEEPWRSGDVHASVSIYARDSKEDLRTARAEVLAKIEAARGVTLAGTQPLAVLARPGDGAPIMEHFLGYADGISNPDIAGSGRHARPGSGKPSPDGGWEPLAAGEFLLGHPDESGEISPAPWPHLLGRNGTYMVYRKLNQKVRSFREHLEAWAGPYPGGLDQLAAKLLGRWQDGAPLSLSPDSDDPNLALDARRNNDFRFADDPEGLKCPLASHIRRVNPRDGDGFGGRLANRHRMIRRSLPYGRFIPLDEPAEDDGDHGIVFVAFVASLRRQFEFVQRQWVNYGESYGQGNDRDLLASGLGSSKMLIPGDSGRPPFLCSGLGQRPEIPAFVALRGGDYFFLPSLTGLRMIARGIDQED